jgi:hypothetical protein
MAGPLGPPATSDRPGPEAISSSACVPRSGAAGAGGGGGAQWCVGVGQYTAMGYMLAVVNRAQSAWLGCGTRLRCQASCMCAPQQLVPGPPTAGPPTHCNAAQAWEFGMGHNMHLQFAHKSCCAAPHAALYCLPMLPPLTNTTRPAPCASALLTLNASSAFCRLSTSPYDSALHSRLRWRPTAGCCRALPAPTAAPPTAAPKLAGAAVALAAAAPRQPPLLLLPLCRLWLP